VIPAKPVAAMGAAMSKGFIARYSATTPTETVV
jgi:hypothetical protein